METAAWIVGGILALCGAVVTVGTALEKVLRAVRAARAPDAAQDARIAHLEEHAQKVDGFLAMDKKRLDAQENSNRITQRALLGLLEHGIDGNSIERMQASRKELEDHLINR